MYLLHVYLIHLTYVPQNASIHIHKYTHRYVRTYVCMYVHMYMYVCMYVCTYVCMYVCTYIRMYVCMYVRMYVCMYVCMYVYTYVCMYVCVYAGMCVDIHTSKRLCVLICSRTPPTWNCKLDEWALTCARVLCCGVLFTVNSFSLSISLPYIRMKSFFALLTDLGRLWS